MNYIKNNVYKYFNIDTKLVEVTGHGGKCCGIGHIHNLDSMSFETLKNILDTYFTVEYEDNCLIYSEQDEIAEYCGHYLAEATTAHHQKKAIEILKKANFKKVNEFTNPNTGNVVFVWHWNGWKD